MKYLLLTLLIMPYLTMANSISIKLNSESIKKANLFVIATKYNQKSRMPVMVKRIQASKFPMTVVLDKSNQMIKGSELKGPFKIKVKITQTGNALDKNAKYFIYSKKVKLGDTIELNLN